MDKETLKYMKNEVTRHEQLEDFRNDLNEFQQKLIKDEPLIIVVGGLSPEEAEIISDLEVGRDYYSHIDDEFSELLREIKDDLIDSVGMTIVKINQIMEEI